MRKTSSLKHPKASLVMSLLQNITEIGQSHTWGVFIRYILLWFNEILTLHASFEITEVVDSRTAGICIRATQRLCRPQRLFIVIQWNVIYHNGNPALTRVRNLSNVSRTGLLDREVADPRKAGIFIRDMSYFFIVIHWSMSHSPLNNNENMPYPVWKYLAYESPQPSCSLYCVQIFMNKVFLLRIAQSLKVLHFYHF